MSALWFFLPLFRRQARAFGLALLLAIVTLAAGTLLLGISGWFLTAAALAASAAAVNLFGASSLVRGLSLVRIVARYGERLTGHDATLKLLSDLRGWLFRVLFPRVPLPERGLRHGDLVSRLTADIDALDTVLLVGIGPVMAALVLGTAVTTTLGLLVPGAGPLYAATLLLAALGVPAVLIGATRRSGAQAVAAAAEARIAVLDAIDGHADLVAFGRVAFAQRAIEAAAGQLAAVRRRLGRAGALAAAAVQMLAGVALIGVLVFGIDALRADAIDGPLLVGLLLGTLGSFEASGAVVRSIARLGVAVAAAERLKALATAEPAVKEAQRPVALPPGGSVAFEHVTFGYDPARPVLRDLDLRVEAGERVAILGPSGCGKSTLLALLLRLHDPQAGLTSVAGTDIRAVAQAELHQRVALLSQSTPVFLGTLRDNLLLGRLGASDDELWRALEAARLADFVRGLPEGLDSFVGETGRTLSAGQARRLCLARILLTRAAILAFDEPTAGLDRDTEIDFLADLTGATQGRTVLLITHAAVPAGAVDRSYEMRGGRLVPAHPPSP